MCDKKLNSRLLNAILFVQDIPTAHAFLVTDSCEASRTTWKNQKPNQVNLQGKSRHEETKVKLS